MDIQILILWLGVASTRNQRNGSTFPDTFSFTSESVDPNIQISRHHYGDTSTANAVTRKANRSNRIIQEPRLRSCARVMFTAFSLQINHWKINLKFYHHTMDTVAWCFGPYGLLQVVCVQIYYLRMLNLVFTPHENVNGRVQWPHIVSYFSKNQPQ